MWGLIFYAIWRFRRRSDDEIPVQTRYNLPLEIFYTIAPVIMVVVFFSHTVKTQNYVLDDDRAGRQHHRGRRPAVVVDLQLRLGEQDRSANDDATDDEFPYSSYVFDSGTGSQIPTSCSRSTRPRASTCTRPTSSTTSASPAS